MWRGRLAQAPAVALSSDISTATCQQALAVCCAVGDG